ncbi:histone [Halosimplex salinum]|uniref:histone n=1 Tax=Halosimplex salinum TaxID=1710538 RepID=UPI000F49A182|nr:histone [Halosimplex salinum]
MEFSTRSIHNLIGDQGNKRVSQASANELGKLLEKYAGDIAEEAITNAEEQGYQTIKENHIRNALNG